MSDAKVPVKTDKFVVPPAWRERCEVLHLNAKTKAEFFPVHQDFIKSLLSVTEIDFILYFAVGWDMYEFIRPREFKVELVKELITTHKQNASQTRICVKKADFGRYEAIVIKYMREKFVAASAGASLEMEPAYKIYSSLSAASQRITRGALDEECYNQISRAASGALMKMSSTKDALNFLTNIVGKEPALYDHAAVTAMVSSAIAWNVLKLQKRESKLAVQAGLLHDVERHCAYLSKPADSTQISLQAVKEITAQKTAGIGFHDSTLEVMQQYRERFDGTGIPKRLKGAAEAQSLNGISRMARIVSIGCAFSEYMLKRQEKLPLPLATIIKLLNDRAQKGEFDPALVKDLFADAATGTQRKPTDGTQDDDDDDFNDEDEY